MVFDERAYSVLVVSSGSRFNDAITPLLPYSEYYPVCFAGNITAARREMLARAYDFGGPVCHGYQYQNRCHCPSAAQDGSL